MALFAISDIHWGAMQLATWVEMTIEAVHNDEGVLNSLYQTVSGEKKCSRCCQLEQDLGEESQRSIQWESKLLVLDLRRPNQLIPPLPPRQGAFLVHEHGNARSDEPLSPPPWHHSS